MPSTTSNNVVPCPFCKREVSWSKFGAHLQSQSHIDELKSLVKKRFMTETMSQLPQFHVKDNVYSVCFGCKKGYCTLQKNHVCSHREAHVEVVKQLCAERDAEKQPAVEEEVPTAVKEESDYMRLMTEMKAMKGYFMNEIQLLRQEIQRLKVTNNAAPNPFIGMPDDQFDDIDTDKLNDEQRLMYEAEDDRRIKEVRAKRLAEAARVVEPKATPLVVSEDVQNEVVESESMTVVESETVEESETVVEPAAEDEDGVAPPGTAMKLATEWAGAIYNKPVRRAPRPEDIDPALHASILEAADAQRRLNYQRSVVNQSNAAGGGPRLPAPAPFQPPAPSVQVSYGAATLVTNTRQKMVRKMPTVQPAYHAALESYDGRIDETQLSAEEVAMWRAEQARIARLTAQITH